MSKLDKKMILVGDFCKLIPIEPKDFETFIELRNREKNKYFLNQNYDVTLEGQRIWYNNYLERDNDIYWGIWRDEDTIVGTIRLYNVNGDTCEEGSCIIDDIYSKEAPYAVEAKYLLTKYAFENLGLKQIVNENKKDNRVMNSLSKQQGFRFIKNVFIGDAEYNYFILEVGDFQKEKIEKLLNYWKER